MAKFANTSEFIFEDAFISNYSSSVASLSDLKDERSYPLVHVCLSFNAALIVTFTMAVLIQLITCVGIYKTSHQIITSIFYHFKINEKAKKIENEWYKFKQSLTLEKENDTTDTKIEMCLVLNTSSPNDVDAILGPSIESNDTNCCMIDMNDHESDCEAEEHKLFQEAINELKLRGIGYLRRLFYRVGIDVSINAIQTKIHQVIERHQLPNISGIDCNPWKDQLQFQVDISLDGYIKRAKLTDYQRELVQKWLKFIWFAKIVASAVMIRMILRVVLIFWLFIWSIHDAIMNGQSVWDLLFSGLIMTPVAWIVWQIDFIVMYHILEQYQLLKKFNDFIKFSYFTKVDDALNPLMIKRCKYFGCDKTSPFLAWYFFMCCFVAIIVSAALVHQTNKMGGHNDAVAECWVAICCMWIYLLLSSCILPCYTNANACDDPFVFWEPWLSPMPLQMFLSVSVFWWTMALYNGIKYDTICDNYKQSDAHGSWSYLMWVIL